VSSVADTIHNNEVPAISLVPATGMAVCGLLKRKIHFSEFDRWHEPPQAEVQARSDCRASGVTGTAAIIPGGGEQRQRHIRSRRTGAGGDTFARTTGNNGTRTQAA
jgi:hypothetical protein